MYNFNHLYYFYMAAKSGGVSAGAKHLRISQPSLSAQIKVLEGVLDLKLFHKIGRNNELTPEGSLIFGYCRQIFELSEEMSELISKRIPFASRRMYIGVSNEVANSFVADVISLFLNRFGEALRPKVMMISGRHDRLVEQLRFREIDIVVTHSAMTNSELENLERAEVPVNLIYSGGKKVNLKTRSMKVKKLLDKLTQEDEVRWVLPSPDFRLRGEIDQFIEKNGLKGRVVFESDVIESLTRSIQDKIGISFLPLAYVAKEIQNKTLVRLGPKKGYWKNQIWLTCHSQTKDDHLMKAFSRAFKEAYSPLRR